VNLRDIGPWLIPPLALIASAAPHYRSSAAPPTEERTAARNLSVTPSNSSALESGSDRSQAPRDQLDCYDQDVRHLLWDFVNANQLASLKQDKLQFKISGSGDNGLVSFEETISPKKTLSGCLKPPNDDELKTGLLSFRVRFLVATLPDPISSHLQHDFDTGLEAIEAAVAEAGYARDRFYFPWDAPSDLSRAPDERKSENDATTKPGLILFRGAEDTNELLILFIVGEVPTSGVSKLALSSALEQIADLSSIVSSPSSQPSDTQSCPPQSMRVGMLGPGFTGSVPSLRLVLQAFSEWTGDAPRQKTKHNQAMAPLCLTVISGNAAGVNQNEFASGLSLNTKRLTLGTTGFTATINPNLAVKAALLDLLHEKFEAKSHDIAILRESDTAFGSQFASSVGTWPEYVDLPFPFDIVFGEESESQYVDLPFPLHISALRSSTSTESLAMPYFRTLFNASTPFPVLVPSSHMSDGIPSFAPELGKPDAQLVMSSLLSTLHEERIGYVAILATDVQDIIYLAKQVHDNCPDAMIFALDTDLLFLGSDVARDLNGMIVIGTYPLFTTNQHLTHPWLGDSAQRQFSNEASEGQFNATLALLGRPDKMLDYNAPFSDPPHQKTRKHHPPVWIEGVGSNGLVPFDVQLSDDPEVDSYFYAPPDFKPSTRTPAIITITYSWPIRVLFWTATILSFVLALWSIGPERFRRYDSNWCPERASSSIPRLVAFVALLFSVLLVYSILSAAFWLPWRTPDPLSSTFFWLPWRTPDPPSSTHNIFQRLSSSPLAVRASMLTLVLLATSVTVQSLMLVTRYVGLAKCGKSFPRTLLYLGMAVLVLIGWYRLIPTALTIYYRLPLYSEGSARFYFRVYRYAIGGGYSPFLPLMFGSLAVLTWAMSLASRFGMLESMVGSVAIPVDGVESGARFLGFEGTSLKDIDRREVEIRARLFGVTHSLSVLVNWSIAVCGLILVHYYCFSTSGGLLAPRRSLEGRTFDLAFIAIFFVAYAGSIFELVRYIAVWSEFKRLLQRLSWHPVRLGCSELGSLEVENDASGTAIHSSRDVPRLSLASSMPTFAALEYSIELADRLIGKTREILSRDFSSEAKTLEIKREANKLEEYCRLIHIDLVKGLQEDACGDFVASRETRLRIQTKLAELSALVSVVLESEWRLTSNQFSARTSLVNEWSRIAQLFLASRILNYCAHVLSHLRNLLGFSIVGFVLMLMSTSSYPFPSSDTMLRFSWVMLLSAVLVGTWIFFQMNRDRLLSLLTGGTPGKIDWNAGLVGHLFLYGLLPIITILGIKFPATLTGMINGILSILPGGGH
jgi:hypothetical protein